MLSGPLNHTQLRMLEPFGVQLSCGSRQQQWRKEHPYAQIKVKDMEKRWLDRENKHGGLNLTSAAWTTFPREERCWLLPKLRLLSSEVWSKMSLLCDHTATKATLRPWTKMANETRPGNERAAEKKPFEAILARLACPQKNRILLIHLVSLLLDSSCTLFTQSHSLLIAFAIAFLQHLVWWLSQMWLNKYSVAWLLNPSITQGKFSQDPCLKGTSRWADHFPLRWRTVQLFSENNTTKSELQARRTPTKPKPNSLRRYPTLHFIRNLFVNSSVEAC